MLKMRLMAIIIILATAGIGYFNYVSESEGGSFPFRLGLDLSGGTHLVYMADVSNIPKGEAQDSMTALRDVIERRVNLFGVSEPIVQVEETTGIISDEPQKRLIVELPGVTDVDAAIELIGRTPLLEFKVERPDVETFQIIEAQARGERLDEDPYISSGLTGRFLKRAKLEFGSTQNSKLLNEPTVAIEFDDEGSLLFSEITKENIGKTIAIYLDGAVISAPVVQDEITGGSAVISGNFEPEEARELTGRLNSGALPVPISLLTTQTIGPSLGADTLNAGIKAGLYGLIVIVVFLIFWYRLPGILAVFALLTYIMMMLALFKVIPVTLTASGIAGFILSLGMAVDANILIFERLKEELRERAALSSSVADDNTATGDTTGGGIGDIASVIEEGFARAWLSIRDGNISSIITAIILFWFGTSMVKGFALVFGLGVLVSMVSAIVVTRALLYAVSARKTGKLTRFLFGTGFGG